MTSDLVPTAGNLPAEPNGFVGRERDLAELVAMLGRIRALTLCGPGGIGKTRLALRIAAALAASYPDGVWIAELADANLADPSAGGTRLSGPEPLGTSGPLVPLVTAALGIRQEPDRPLADTLAEALRPRTMLLILDTCEHLVQACAELVQRLLANCPGLRVIATSREPLRVRGEVIWRVPPLGVPALPAGECAGLSPQEAADSEAVQLFVERAAAARPGFRLDESNATAVAGICRTLDGVPLAIELAAARIRALSTEQISVRLADRFELLAHGDRTAPPRQQTLRATVEWSYDLLTAAERTLLSRLSVFHGWSLRMAEQVCSDSLIPARDVLDLLTALIDKSLVSVDGELNGNARYRLLDTVRELAAEYAIASGDMPRMRARHRDCTLALAEQIASQAFVRGEPSWPERVAMYHRVRADRANLQLALAYCVQHGDAEEGMRLCYALAGSWLASGEVAEGASWLDRLLSLPGPVPPGVHARALALRAELSFEQQDYPAARGYATACVERSLACKDGNPAAGLRLIALTALMDGRAGEALEHADAAVTAARQMADEWEEGVALAVRGAVTASQGRLAAAEQAFHEALDVLSDNNGWGVANVLYGLGQVARGRADPARAVQYFEAALAIYRQIDARPEMARCLAGTGWVALSQGDLGKAATDLAESMRLSLVTGHRLAIARGLRALAALAGASGDLSVAITLEGAALTMFEAIGTPSSASSRRRLDQLLDAASDALGAESVAALLAAGKQLSPYQAVLLTGAELGISSAPEAATQRSSGPVLADPRLDSRPRGDASANGAGSVREAGAPPARPPAAAGVPKRRPVTLTDRERQVASLVARGLSNRAIGEQLFISHTTAARHVANIFAKLGFSSRSQIVAWMATRNMGTEG
ncbi:MAG TPA: tetratricopeptide repeat protein [Streptosporangiaceae bacterium]